MEKPDQASRPSQASTPQSDDELEIHGNELERLKLFPKAAPPPAPTKCEYCGKTLYGFGFIFGKSIVWMNQNEPCDCKKSVEAAEKREAEEAARKKREAEEAANKQLRDQVRRIVGASGVGARFRLRTFDTFEMNDTNRKAALICQKYANQFNDKLPKNGNNPGRNGLFITGPKGTGKTHLVAAIANQLMDDGVPVICMTMIDLLEKIKCTYADARQQRGGSFYDEAGVLNTYATVPLLIIDDLGKEQATEWALSKIYAIINARYEALLPTIITTNYSEAELLRRLTPKETGDPTTADAAIDRLREMCAAIITTGESWRTK